MGIVADFSPYRWESRDVSVTNNSVRLVAASVIAVIYPSRSPGASSPQIVSKPLWWLRHHVGKIAYRTFWTTDQSSIAQGYLDTANETNEVAVSVTCLAISTNDCIFGGFPVW